MEWGGKDWHRERAAFFSEKGGKNLPYFPTIQVMWLSAASLACISLFQLDEPPTLLVPSRNLSYFALIKIAQIEFEVLKDHHDFIEKVILSSSSFRIPNPPSKMGRQHWDHLIQWHLNPPQKKLAKSDLILLKIAFGGANAASIWTGRLWRTCRIRRNLPPWDTAYLSTLIIFFSILETKS